MVSQATSDRSCSFESDLLIMSLTGKNLSESSQPKVLPSELLWSEVSGIEEMPDV